MISKSCFYIFLHIPRKLLFFFSVLKKYSGDNFIRPFMISFLEENKLFFIYLHMDIRMYIHTYACTSANTKDIFYSNVGQLILYMCRLGPKF
jgi:hypothetical protein